MAGILSAFELTALRAIFGDSRASGVPASWTVDLYAGDPDDGGTVISGGGYAALTVANTTANFPVDPDDANGLLLTVSWPASTAAWPTDATFLVLSSSSTARLAFGLSDAVTVAQAGTTVTITQPIHWTDLADMQGVE